MLGSLTIIRLTEDLNQILIYAVPVSGFLLKGYTYYYSMSSVATKRVLHVGNGIKLIRLVLLYSHIPIYGRLLARYRVDKIMTLPHFRS